MFITLKTKLKHTSNGIRHKKPIQKNVLNHDNFLIKNLKSRIFQKAGRNDLGRITVRHKSSLHKVKAITLAYPQTKSTSIVICVALAAKKTSFITLNFNFDSKKFWATLASRNTCAGIVTKINKEQQEYFSAFYGSLINFPTGITVFNLSSSRSKYCYSKSAGTFCTLLQKQQESLLVRLPSGKIISMPLNTQGAIGKVSNKLHQRIYLGKAGIKRHLGFRPTVRGVAMNPVDHPHGGRTNGGVHPKTPWGVPTRGKRTVKNKNYVKI